MMAAAAVLASPSPSFDLFPQDEKIKLPDPPDNSTVVPLDANYEIPLLPGTRAGTKRAQMDSLLRRVLTHGKYSLLPLLHVGEMPKDKLKWKKGPFDLEIDPSGLLGPLDRELVIGSDFCAAAKLPTDPDSRRVMEIDPALDSRFVYRWKFDAAAVTNAADEPAADRILIQAKVRLYVQRRSIVEPDDLFRSLPDRDEAKVDALKLRLKEAIRKGALELLRSEKVPVDDKRLEELAAAQK